MMPMAAVSDPGRRRIINVLHLRDTTEIGGPGKTILETHRAIDRDRFQLHLGVFQTRSETGESPFVRAARSYGMPVHMVQGYNQYDPRMIQQVVGLVRRLGIDILHAHEVKSDVIAYLASRLHRVPVMTTVHGRIGNSAKQRAMMALGSRVVRRFDRVIAVSKKIERDLVGQGVPPAALRMLHNAIVLEQYRRSGQTGFVAQLTGRPLAGPVISVIGRISPEKGQLDLLDALAMLPPQGPFTVVFAGSGPSQQLVAERIAALGLGDRVFLAGYLQRPQQLLEETDLLVLPSHTEGLPNVVLEALAFQVPVLATAVGGTPEIVEDGDTGRLVPARTPARLAAALGDFLSNPEPWRAMARRGRQRVESDFNFETRTRRLEAIYADLLGVTAS
jgi:glycosyltransferase involved in cell wall biosynthesis